MHRMKIYNSKVVDSVVAHASDINEAMKPAKDDPMFDTPYYKIFSTTCP